MPGFIIHTGKSSFELAPEVRKKLLIERINADDFFAERRVVNKFMNDRVFLNTTKYMVIVEGIVLNNHELMDRYASCTWQDCIIRMYEQEGETFFRLFRGSFSGALFDRAIDKWIVYTGHTGEKQVFFSRVPGGYLFGSEMRFMVEGRKNNGLPVSIDRTGAYMSLSLGFCIEDRTIVNEIHKLTAGHYIRLVNDELEIIQYHRFSNAPNLEMTQLDAIKGIDRLFRQAIKRQFDKDIEYGYDHLACLSGGLDSRMTVWVSHQMGYSNQLNITYSQSGYLDFSIAQQIAIDLHHDWLFKPLDGGDFITDIDEISAITYGSANFFGLAHGRSMENLLDYSSLGVVHTGQLGDVILGSYLSKADDNGPFSIKNGAYSQEVIEQLKDYPIKDIYADKELFMIYNRGFCGIAQGLLTFQENSESYSPFTDVDFMEFALSIPLKWRVNHKIYFDWILQKYPDAAEYVWEHTGEKIKPFENKELKYTQVMGKKIPVPGNPEFPGWLKGSILRRLGLRKKGQKPKTIVMASKNNMNPVDYWYQTNPRLKEFIDQYWEGNQNWIPEGQMKDDMTHLYKDCVLYDKLQCLSVLSAMKLILS